LLGVHVACENQFWQLTSQTHVQTLLILPLWITFLLQFKHTDNNETKRYQSTSTLPLICLEPRTQLIRHYYFLDTSLVLSHLAITLNSLEAQWCIGASFIL
jgi:hypothetical protein